ncbi:NAD(P)H-binding protein [Microbacterium lacticum]
MPRIAIIGGTSRTGLILTSLLVDAGADVRSTVRSGGEASARAGADAVRLDLDGVQPAALAPVVDGTDVVVYLAGAGYGSTATRKRAIDRDAAIAVAVAASEAATAPRMIVVSTMGADASTSDSSPFGQYFRLKGEADDEVIRLAPRWTIVRPSGLSDIPPTGRVRLGTGLDGGSLPRGDLARLLAHLALAGVGEHAVVDVTGGSTPIETVDLGPYTRKEKR